MFFASYKLSGNVKAFLALKHILHIFFRLGDLPYDLSRHKQHGLAHAVI